MKKLSTLLLCALLMACGQKTEKKETEETVKAPKQLLTFKGKGDTGKHVVLVSGDEEYRSEEALPQLAKILSEHHGFTCTVLFAQRPDSPGIVDANYLKNIPGLKALDTADAMVLFTRFRALPDEQMKPIDNYLKAGKPIVAIRTATHAFNFAEDSTSNYVHYGNYYNGEKKEWTDGFGRLVLGEKWHTHHGHHKHQSTRGIIPEETKSHPITNGIENGEIWGSTDVYGVRLPLPGDAEHVVLGQVVNRKGEYDENDVFYGMRPTDDEIATVNDKEITVNETLMPIAWTKSYQIPNGKMGKAFTSTIGSSSDLMNEGVRRLLINGVFWALDMPVPEKANVNLIGAYDPSAYGFQTDEYWLEKQLKIEDLE
ncbi:ThuA domain-containing protein [Ulvibacterium sp.]|uniref:ThuA domain-containing protein n=1 Tax=Ulvibacterium sp. TaxID=2665914 RepID=UPI00261F7DC0|nr:ThuA domain-containing protein [Ulvibacterium sp.]